MTNEEKKLILDAANIIIDFRDFLYKSRWTKRIDIEQWIIDYSRIITNGENKLTGE